MNNINIWLRSTGRTIWEMVCKSVYWYAGLNSDERKWLLRTITVRILIATSPISRTCTSSFMFLMDHSRQRSSVIWSQPAPSQNCLVVFGCSMAFLKLDTVKNGRIDIWCKQANRTCDLLHVSFIWFPVALADLGRINTNTASVIVLNYSF